MKRTLVLFVAVFLALVAPSAGTAQTRSVKRPVTARPEPVPDPVVIRDAFALTTPNERWSLDDPIPSASVLVAGKTVTLTDRLANKSVSPDGETQILYPVSWYQPYEGKNPDIKYVVVRYKAGRACSVMAEYLPNRVAMPKASFQAHPDGHSYYSDVETVRQDGRAFYKQAISSGRSDGKGGLFVDMMVMYAVDDKPAAVASGATRP
jgi:hypothetical protein